MLQTLIGPLAWNPYVARVPSFLLAATSTWLINRHWTFADRRGRARLPEWGRYLLTMLGGGAVNYATYAVLLAGTDTVAAWPVIGVAAGSLAGMTVNYLGADRWIFGARRA